MLNTKQRIVAFSFTLLTVTSLTYQSIMPANNGDSYKIEINSAYESGAQDAHAQNFPISEKISPPRLRRASDEIEAPTKSKKLALALLLRAFAPDVSTRSSR